MPTALPSLRFRRTLPALSLVLALLSACALPPSTVQYSDPMQELGSAAPAVRYDNLALGVRVSENTRQTMDLVRKTHEAMAAYGALANTSAMQDLDAAALVKGINSILDKTFRSVVRLDGEPDPRGRDVDLTMLLDLQVVIGQMSGQATTIQAKGIFTDKAGNVLGAAEGQGQGTVPFPASTFGFGQATAQVLKAFSSSLWTSDQLRAGLERLSAPAMALAAPAPVPAGPEPAPAQAVPDPGGIAFGRYHALVIGINAYRSLPPLKTAASDAEEVARVLRENYGFSVRLLKDATRADIVNALGRLRQELGEGDNLVIYYAGHGWLDAAADEGYWLPADATSESELNWVSNAFMTSSLKALLAKHVLVVADSCYSGKLVRGLNITRITPDYLERMAAKRARLVLSSGGLEPVADSGGGGHSVFAKAFLDSLRENTGVLDGASLFSRLRRPVMVNSDQTPEYADVRKAGHEGGDFLFVRRK